MKLAITIVLAVLAVHVYAYAPLDYPATPNSTVRTAVTNDVSGTSDETATRNAILKSRGIRFQENRGQIIDTDGRPCNDVMFVADAPGARLYLRNNGISYVFSESDAEMRSGQQLHNALDKRAEVTSSSRKYRMDMTLEGSNPRARIRAEAALPGYVHYYLPHCPDGITGIREYERIIYENVYDNIDFELLSVDGRMKYNFIVRPGGQVNDIRMRYDGAESAALTKAGALSIATPIGGMDEAAPYTYCGVESNEIRSCFRQEGNVISFAVDSYDHTQTLVIDPWSTYYGGSADEYWPDMVVDGSGNVIATGNTESLDLPLPLSGAHQTQNNGYIDAFVVKFDPNGVRLWATYYGGSGSDFDLRITTDAVGNVYIGGSTYSTDFPVTQNAFQSSLSGDYDAFIVKFTTSGVLLWATYCGGSATEFTRGLATDSGNNLYICGMTKSRDYPVTAGAFQTSIKGNKVKRDAFVTRFDQYGGMAWSTYYGGSDWDEPHGMTIDDANNVVVTGFTASDDFPTSSGAMQTALVGEGDAFVLKFGSAGNRIWATYLGGPSWEAGCGVATNASNDIVIVGNCEGSGFPATAGAFQTTSAGDYDAFVAKLTAAGSKIWATYYGGSSDDGARDVTIDAGGNIIVTGETESSDFPVTSGAFQTWRYNNHILGDPYVFKLTGAGNQIWGSFYAP